MRCLHCGRQGFLPFGSIGEVCIDEIPAASASRSETLHGATYKVRLVDEDKLYIIINEQDGKPFEIFIRHDAPELFEWTAALTVLITRLLRAGQPLEAIAAELQEIHSPTTGHMVPGTHDHCPSYVARIGQVLQEHAERLQARRAA